MVCLGAQPPAAKAPATKSTAAKAPATRTSAATRHKAPMLNPAVYKAKAPETYRAKFTTTKGIFVVEVTRAWAPLGADRFYNLVKGGYYDDAPFYRVIPNFMAQFGFSASPAVSKAWDRATFKDDPTKQSNKRGTITFATSGPNSRTTQVFINFGDNSRLDNQGFAPFGTVVEGMDVVDKLYSGYGDGSDLGGRGPTQAKLADSGLPYVKKDFPNMDIITSAVIEPSAPASGAAKPPATTK
jgi:peptidyl-prolyl cis-trans isomerase A (cyclophilin A)